MSTLTKESVTKKAYAKINLGLDVIRRREDGYHEVKMIMQTIGLYDVLTFTRKKESGITVTTNKTELPGDKNNLIYKVADLLMETYSIKEGIQIDLIKNIPMAAGMAGGSTDAAAVFHGMNEIFDLKVTNEEMEKLAVTIGADVPYCLYGGCALSEGIGEILTQLSAVPECYILIAKPDISVSTKFVYENLHADQLTRHPDIDGMKEAIFKNNLTEVTKRMENVLETVTVKKYPLIQDIKCCMKEQGALNSLMSGSGPTVFGIFETKKKAQTAYEVLKEKKLAKEIFLTEPINL